KELQSRTDMSSTDDAIEPGAANIEIDSVSDMDEIELDLSDEPFDEDDEDAFDDDADDEDEEE
ncbi:MAG: hypothetical protein IJ074_06015, partial [Clostridia bacterium]|nr:hypothetical protein [Clostridia bacterium]